MNDKSTTQDVEITGYDAHAGPVITYRASIRNGRGLELANPVILMRIEHTDKTSPWVDAERVITIVTNERKQLIDNIDADFIPNEL